MYASKAPKSQAYPEGVVGLRPTPSLGWMVDGRGWDNMRRAAGC